MHDKYIKEFREIFKIYTEDPEGFRWRCDKCNIVCSAITLLLMILIKYNELHHVFSNNRGNDKYIKQLYNTVHDKFSEVKDLNSFMYLMKLVYNYFCKNKQEFFDTGLFDYE